MKKNILLIGGSYGIGLRIVQQLQQTHSVYVASRTQEELLQYPITHIKFDATEDELDLTQLPENLHGFVYCPGSIHLKPFKRLKLDAFTSDMDINFFAMVKTLQSVIPKMEKGASVVLFSTVAATVGMPFHTSVAAAKGAIEGFAKSLAAEYAPNIRVNTIAPSLVNTPLAERLINSDAKMEMMENRHPLKAIGQPEDIAQMVTFLLSDKSKWITGQTIGIDGGLSTLKPG